MNISNQSVLVTGASRGLGRELAKAFGRRGALVVLVARNEHALAEAVRDVPGEAHGLVFDVGDKDAIHRISGAAAALVGTPSIVVHNASTLGPIPMPLLVDTDCEDFERVLAVNLVGPLRLTKALAGPMVLARSGLFVFVSSDAAVNAYPRWGAYGISKAAQDHLARTLAAELDPVRFFSVDPGEMDTQMHAEAMPDADRSTLASPADVAERIIGLVERAESFPNGARLEAA
jgi:NAD(P)-dependent dehydrogenase (short-subunit alcohol dehydrogenase family)